jgi:hypothetical protein
VADRAGAVMLMPAIPRSSAHTSARASSLQEDSATGSLLAGVVERPPVLVGGRRTESFE